MNLYSYEYVTPEQVINNLVLLRNLCLEVTDACNLACDYCVYRDLYGDHDKRFGKMMNFQQVKSIIEYLASYWENGVTGRMTDRITISFYGGEPLLNIGLIKDVIRYLKETNFKREFVYNMTTNAMLLDKYIDFLVENDFSLLVSLDGDIEGSGHRRRHDGSSSFPLVYNNLKYAMKEYPDYFSKRVRFNVVLHDLNSVESAMNFIYREFGSYPNVSEINPRGLKNEMIQRFRVLYKDMEDSIRHANDVIAIQENMGFRFPQTSRLIQYLRNESGNYYDGYLSLLSGLTIAKPRPAPGTCMPFAKKVFMTVNGKILQCERIGQEFYLGKVDMEGVHLDPQTVAAEFNRRLDKISSICFNCNMIATCKKCFYYFKNVNSNQPTCPNFGSDDHKRASEIKVRHYLKNNPHLLELIQKEHIVQ